MLKDMRQHDNKHIFIFMYDVLVICGLLQPLCMMYRRYLGYYIIYVGCYRRYAGCRNLYVGCYSLYA